MNTNSKACTLVFEEVFSCLLLIMTISRLIHFIIFFIQINLRDLPLPGVLKKPDKGFFDCVYDQKKRCPTCPAFYMTQTRSAELGRIFNQNILILR